LNIFKYNQKWFHNLQFKYKIHCKKYDVGKHSFSEIRKIIYTLYRLHLKIVKAFYKYRPEKDAFHYFPLKLTIKGSTKEKSMYVDSKKPTFQISFFWMVGDRAFIFYVSLCIPCDKTFLLVHVPSFLTSWPWSLTNFLKILNVFGNIVWMLSDRALIFHLCIPCDKTFLLVP
jgi:hypothetical protein